jgi:hypothetical protein
MGEVLLTIAGDEFNATVIDGKNADFEKKTIFAESSLTPGLGKGY